MAILVRRQLLGIAAAASALVGATYLGNAAISLLKTGAAYKAKLLCSEHFVAGRQFEDATNELEVDDLRPLRFIRASVDSALSGVSARVLHLRREARYHVEYGCTLTPTDESPPEPAERRGVERTSGEATRSGTWASGSDLTQKSLAEVLDEAFTDVGSRQPKRTRAVVVLQHGKIITERYATGFGPETPLVGWSLAKSVLNALVGVAVRDGLLELEAPVPLQSWSRPGDRRQEITVGSLLRMSSGLEFDEDQTDPSSDIVHMLFEAPDMAAFAASKILAAPPGTTWSYSSGTTMILSRLLRERLGESAYREFPRRVLFEPLGMYSATLEVDPAGNFVASSYMYATARERARLGQLYLQDGVWLGQRILPEGWVSYTTTPAPADPSGQYGAHFWLSTPAEYRGEPVPLPAGVYHAVGHEAQFVTVVPSHNVVIVRLGRTRVAESWQHDRFVAAILAALPQ